MFTDLEVTPLKARLRRSGLAVVALALSAAPLFAQSPQKTGERVMIPTLQSSDKELGVQAADALDVALLDEVDARAIQRPARLLAEVADGDRDQAMHRDKLTLT